MTFQDIEKLNVEQLTSKKGRGDKKDDSFRPQDILNFDDDSGSEDEILKKFSLNLGRKKKSNFSSKKGSFTRPVVPNDYQINTPQYKKHGSMQGRNLLAIQQTPNNMISPNQ